MKKSGIFIGLGLLIVILILGKTQLANSMLFVRLIIGLALGYSLGRAFTGFAGSVNRAYRGGSTHLMRAMVFMFFITCVMTAAILYGSSTEAYNLWVYPINLGTIIGGIVFGVGMSFSACCGSGVLTDIVTGLPRALIVLFFFMVGVFVGFPIENSWSIVTESVFNSARFGNGVFLPDLFYFDGAKGYIGALLFTGVLCLIVVVLSYQYEKYRKQKGTFYGIGSEILQGEYTLPGKEMTQQYTPLERLFSKPWTLLQGSFALAIVFVVLFSVSKAGWGASTPYGFWFGKILMTFGVPAESIARFVLNNPAADEAALAAAMNPYLTPVLQQGFSLQNFGIILGMLIFVLMSGRFTEMVTEELKLSWQQVLQYVAGGFMMGFGSRFAKGCNVGALYSPIANFSLSGWVFLVFLIGGAILGNMILKRLKLI